MSRKVLITGMSGFVGSYLKTELESNNFEVMGTCLATEPCAGKQGYYIMDLLDRQQIEEVLSSYKPDEIYHLAGQSSVALSWKNPQLTFDINVKGAINLLDAIRSIIPECKTLIVGSSDEYGRVEKNTEAIKEEYPLNPQTPYGVSKVTQEKIAQLYVKAYGLKLIMVRPFNHIGPGQTKGFVVSDFASRIAELDKSNKNVMKVGNLDAMRDFLAVEDVVYAYRLLMENGVFGEVYNVGSAVPTAIKDILNIMLQNTNKKIIVERDASLYRPVDVPVIICDNSKLKRATCWEPKVKLEEVLTRTLNWWREKLA